MKSKGVINDGVSLGQLLEFEVVFPEEKLIEPEEYLAGGSKDFILNVASAFLGFKNQNSKFDNPKEFLEMLFSIENNDFANSVYQKIKEVEAREKKVGIINPISSLQLFETFFQRESERVTQTSAQFEVNLLKAYLALNSKFTEAQKLAFTSIKELGNDLKIPMMLFCMYYPASDKLNYSIKEMWVTQTIKAIYLFQFLESHTRTQPLLETFLNEFRCNSWQDYLKSLLPVTMAAIRNENEAHTDIIVTRDDKFEESCAFLEKLIVREDDELDEYDFLTLRSQPFYKVEEGVYRIIFNLFVIEKIFKGAYFLLREANNKLPKAQKIKEFKSFYGGEFSEKVLLYKVMNSIYSGKAAVRFTGKELDDKNISGAPDYYVRQGRDIILIESKDFLIPKEAKMSFDFSRYEEEFEKKLYFYNDKGEKKPKAVLQLIYNIKRLLQKQFEADTSYHYREAAIYPVLLTYDHQYDTPGFNSLINSWFQFELDALQEEGFYTRRIKPLIVVNIDSLIFHQVGLQRSFSLQYILKMYADHIRIHKGKTFTSLKEKEIYYLSRFIPFSGFIDKFFHKVGLVELPPILEILGPALFKEDYYGKIKG